MILNPEHVTEAEAESHYHCEAARTIVLDPDEKIALLYVAKGNYFTIPGGGIEESEDNMQACQRECMGEIGCDVKMCELIGTILEYRKDERFRQVSYCYLAHMIGTKGKSLFTAGEKEFGYELSWLSYASALKALSERNTHNDIVRNYIMPRSIAFLEAAAKYIQE